MSAINQMFMGLFGAVGAVVSGVTSLVNKWYPITNSEPNYLVRYINGKIWSFKQGPVVSVSTDGVSWESLSPLLGLGVASVNIYLNDIAYGAGLYVMVGGTNSHPIIITSPDGVTWTRRTTTYALALISIAWSPTLNLFVASTATGVVLRSPDGITWTTGATYGTSSKKIIWGGGRFVITGTTTQQLIKSTDGITFTASGLPSAAGTRTDDIDYSPSLGLYAVGVNGTSIFTSPDATTWTARTALGASTNGIVWTGDKFIATTPTGVTTSANGTTWSTASIAGTALTSLGKLCAIDNNTVVAVGSTSAGTAISYDSGVTWGTSITEIATSNGQFRSTSTTAINAITYSGGRYWAAVSNIGGQLYYSTDKKVWFSTAMPAGTAGTSYSAVYAELASTPYWVAPGTTSTVGRVLTSFDGDTWVARTVATQGTSWNDAATDGVTTVMVNNGGQIATTTDGVTFTNRTSSTTAALRSVVYAGGKFVAIGQNAAVYSVDGITWTNVSTSFGTLNALKLIHDGTQFVAVGTGTATVNTKVSANGITWATGPVAPWGTSSVSSLAHNGSVYVAMTTATNQRTVYVGTSLSNLVAVTLPITITLATNGLVAVETEFTLQSNNTSFQLSSVDNGATWTVWETAEPSAGNGLSNHTHNLDMLDGSLVLFSPFVGLGYPMIGKFNPDTKSFSKISVNPAAGALATFGIIKVGSTYIAGLGNGTTSGNISTSTDLGTWVTRISPAATVRGFASNTDGSVIVAATNSGGTTGILGVYRSIDGGITWARPTTPTTANVNKVIWANNQFVAVGTNVSPAGVIQTSPDGQTWTTRFTGGTADVFTDIAYGNGIYLAVSGGTGFKFYTSVDGVTWTPQGTTAFTPMNCVEFGNGTFWAVGQGQTNGGSNIYTTTNGTVFTTDTSMFNSAVGLAWDGIDSFWTITTRGSLFRYKIA